MALTPVNSYFASCVGRTCADHAFGEVQLLYSRIRIATFLLVVKTDLRVRNGDVVFRELGKPVHFLQKQVKDV